MTREATWRVVLWALALPHLALATWAITDHGSFSRDLAPFGPVNGHLVDDYAAASATFGVALLLAARRREWRLPLLALTLVWTALHTLSHVAAAGAATRTAIGPAEALFLGATTLLLVYLVRLAARDVAQVHRHV